MNEAQIEAIQRLLTSYEKQLGEWQARKMALGGSVPAYIEDEIRALTARVEDLRKKLEEAGAPLPKLPGASETGSVTTGGGAYIGGNVNTGGGDLVGRDKTVWGDTVYGDKIAGDKSAGDTITVGDISGGTGIAIGRKAQATVYAPVTNATSEQFTRLLQELGNALEQARLDDDEREAVREDLRRVAVQVQQPTPKLSLIRRSLNNVKEVIEAAAGVGAAAAGLSAMVQRALDMAQQLFR